VEPGLVRPVEWRPDLANPLLQRREDAADDEPVLKPVAPQPPGNDHGAAWHLCGIGIKDSP
jgi:hypothetical protein